MKLLWTDEHYHWRVNGAPREWDRFDRFRAVAVTLAILYFGGHLLAVWLR